jgi:hypothetical protein
MVVSGVSTSEELDMMNRMDEVQAMCYTCRKKGHFARNCPDKDKGKGAVRGGKTSSSKSKSTYLRAEDRAETESEDSESDEEFSLLNPSTSRPMGM